jgi:hypothetical protein
VNGLRQIRILCAFGAFLAVSWACGTAHAQGNIALAEKLFQDGRELFTSGNYDAACPKFAESYRLDPGAGTLLNLAACHEKQGKTATAWSEFELAHQELLRSADERATYAATQAKNLKGTLSYLTIEVATDAKLDGLVVTLDGTAVGDAVWGTESPVDPGRHRVSASSPGHQAWEQEVELKAGSDRVIVRIPKLDALEGVAAPLEPAGEVAVAEGSPGISTAAIVSGAATLAMGGLFAVSGLVYLDEKKKADDPANLDAPTNRDSANTWGVVNLAAAAGAVVGAGLTTYFLVQGNSDDAPPSAMISPWLSPQIGGAALSGHF